jgi:hypothetical protein
MGSFEKKKTCAALGALLLLVSAGCANKAVPVAAAEISAYTATDTSVTLQWDPSPSEAAGKRFFYSVSCGSEDHVREYSEHQVMDWKEKACTVTVEGLAPVHEYTFVVSVKMESENPVEYPPVTVLTKMPVEETSVWLPRISEDDRSKAAPELNKIGYEFHANHELEQAARYFGAATETDGRYAIARYNLACTLSLLFGERKFKDVNLILEHLHRAYLIDAGIAEKMKLASFHWFGRRHWRSQGGTGNRCFSSIQFRVRGLCLYAIAGLCLAG